MKKQKKCKRVRKVWTYKKLEDIADIRKSQLFKDEEKRSLKSLKYHHLILVKQGSLLECGKR